MKNKYVIWIYVFLIISSAAAALLAVKNIKISPDSMRFGLVSQQILSGNGIRVPIIRLEDNYIPINGAVPFLDQTPLLPILLAMLGGITPQNFLAAQIINLLCYVSIAVFTFLLMRNLCDNKGIALLAGVLVSFSYPLLRVTHHIWNEPLFIALTAAAIYFLNLSRRPGLYLSHTSLSVASICAGVAILARNAGISLVPVFLWEVFRLIKNRNAKSKYVSSLLALTIPLLTMLGLLVRNYVISGSIRGFVQPSPERSYLSAVAGTINMIFAQFQLGRNSIILIELFMLLLVLSVLVNSNVRKEALKASNSGLDSILIFILSYTSLICVTMAKQQARFELRYMSPLVPFLFVFSILSIVFLWERIQFRGFSKLSLAGIIVSLGVMAAGVFYKTLPNMPEFYYKQEKAYSILNSCTYKWIKENYGRNTIIVTNKPYHLSFFGGYSTIALPHKRFNPNIVIPDMESVLPQRMSKFGSRVLVLFEEAEARYDGNYIAGLFNKRGTNEKFILSHECPDGVVYYLKE